jgi:hypothetical protein
MSNIEFDAIFMGGRYDKTCYLLANNFQFPLNWNHIYHIYRLLQLLTKYGSHIHGWRINCKDVPADKWWISLVFSIENHWNIIRSMTICTIYCRKQWSMNMIMMINLCYSKQNKLNFIYIVVKIIHVMYGAAIITLVIRLVQWSQ